MFDGLPGPGVLEDSNRSMRPTADNVVAEAITDHEAAADPHPGYVTTAEGATLISDHNAAADPHTGYQKESEKDAASGYAGLSASSKLAGAQQTYGTGANTACVGNDARLSDARTPTVHSVIGAEHNGFPGGTTDFLRADGAFATPPAGSDPFSTLVAVLASDQATASPHTTAVTLTGLVFTFLANSTYVVEVVGVGISGTATTGWGMNIDTSVAVSLVTLTFFHQLANTGTLTGGSQIADAASAGVSSGTPGTSNVPFYAVGLVKSGANGGTAQLRWHSEVDAISTCRAGTTMRVHKVA